VEPSEEGLSYGAGFLTTSFSRWGRREALPLLPVLRSLNLGFNKLTNAALEALRIEGGLKTMRVLNLENNALEGELDAELIGLGQDRMPELAVLNLSGNVYLREVVGELASGAKVEMAGCNVRDAPRGQTSASNGTWGTSNQAGTKAPTAAAGGVARPDLPVPKPDLTLVYHTYPAATFDSEPLDVDFDLYLPPNPTGNPLPLIIWFHGGGLLQGNKENLPPHFRRLPAHAFPTPEGERHVAVISPNYRLAPQVPILDILADMSALFDFVRTKLNDRLAKDGQEHTVDTDRICLSGGSAGGYLALIGGLAMPSKTTDEQVGGYRGHAGIRCIAPFYPITDLTDAFWATETIPVPWSSRVIPHDEARPHIDLKAPPIKTAISGGPRSVLYTYMLQHGLFPGLLFLKQRSVGSGLDGFRPSPEALSITTRLQLLTKLGAQRPPVYLVYGTADRAVQPFEKTVECLRESTGELEVEVREGADHAFDEETSEECEAFREWVGVKLFA
jgi:acetyl esterase/lipase